MRDYFFVRKISYFLLYYILFFLLICSFGGKFEKESLENTKINCKYILSLNDQRKRKIDQNPCFEGGP